MRCRLVVLVRADATSVRATGEGKNQAVLICGESGAGKTECCKFVLAYLIAKKESTVERLDEKLMATNDPLEAFGNDRTVTDEARRQPRPAARYIMSKGEWRRSATAPC